MKRRTYFITATVLALVIVGFCWQATTFSQSNKSNLPQSKLGVKGEMGFVITIIDNDSPLRQAGLKPGDIITGLNEQVTSIEKFQQDVAASAPGTEFDITYLRFNSTTGKLEEQKTKVKTISFVSQTQRTARTIPARAEKVFPLQGCEGCCDRCQGFLPGEQQCEISPTYTGKTACRVDTSGRCRFLYCA